MIRQTITTPTAAHAMHLTGRGARSHDAISESSHMTPTRDPVTTGRAPEARSTCDARSGLMPDHSATSPGPGPDFDDLGPPLLLETGLPGGSDARRMLKPGQPCYGLALVAWRHQDKWDVPRRTAFFSDLERLWPEQSARPSRAAKTMSPDGLELTERRARRAARMLERGATEDEVAGQFGVRRDTLRRTGVWSRAADIRRDGGPLPLKPAPPNGSGLAATVHVGVMPGPGQGVAGFACVTADGSGADRIVYYDVRTLLPRVFAMGESAPSPAGLRILARPLRRRGPGQLRPSAPRDH